MGWQGLPPPSAGCSSSSVSSPRLHRREQPSCAVHRSSERQAILLTPRGSLSNKSWIASTAITLMVLSNCQAVSATTATYSPVVGKGKGVAFEEHTGIVPTQVVMSRLSATQPLVFKRRNRVRRQATDLKPSDERVPALYQQQEDGSWSPASTPWSLNGKVYGEPTATMSIIPTPSSTTPVNQGTDLDNLVVAATTSATQTSSTVMGSNSTSIATPTSTPSSSYTTVAVSIPSGWQATPRQTSFYAVPIIIAVSIITAIIVVGAILGSVIWRRRRRNRLRKRGKKLKEVDDEKLVEGKDDPKGNWREQGIMRTAIGKIKGKLSSSRRRRQSRTVTASQGLDSHHAPHNARGHDDSFETASARGSDSSSRRRMRSRGTPVVGAGRGLRRRLANVGSDGGGRSVTGSYVQEDEEIEADNGSERSLARPDRHQSACPLTLTQRLDVSSSACQSSSSTGDRPVVQPTSSPQLYTGSHESLSRTISNLSLASHRTSLLDTPLEAPPQTSVEFYAANALLPSVRSSTFGGLFSATCPDAVGLPALGPPAYMPSTSTIGVTSRLSDSCMLSDRSTRRHLSHGLPLDSSVLSDHVNHRSTADDDDDDCSDSEVLLWPEEKGHRAAGRIRRRQLRETNNTHSRQESARMGDVSALPVEQDDPEEMAYPSPYSGHVATDDKAVLARLREMAVAAAAAIPAQSSSSSSSPMLDDEHAPSAPVWSDLMVDEDGFERFDFDLAEDQGQVQHFTTLSCEARGDLPAPPFPVDTSSNLSNLPVYHPGVAGILAQATAPLSSDEEEEDDGDGDGVESLERYGSAVEVGGLSGGFTREEHADI